MPIQGTGGHVIIHSAQRRKVHGAVSTDNYAPLTHRHQSCVNPVSKDPEKEPGMSKR